jgi:hypothetical protein
MTDKPRFLLCEDGSEYLERFERFLSARFEFVQSRDAAALFLELEGATGDRARPFAGILLDLDFRRTDPARLITEQGLPIAQTSKEERARLVGNQGIAILSALRKKGWRIPVLLFADLEDPRQREYLESRFAPLEIIASHVGLDELQRRFEALGNWQAGSSGG